MLRKEHSYSSNWNAVKLQKRGNIYPVLVYIVSSQILTGVDKLKKLGKTISQSKVTWNNQAGYFTTKEKVKVGGLK